MEHILLECCTNTNHVLGLQLDRRYGRSWTPFEQLLGAVVRVESSYTCLMQRMRIEEYDICAVLDEYALRHISMHRGTMVICPGHANDAAVTPDSGVEDKAAARAHTVSVRLCAEMLVVVPYQ